MSMHQTPLRTAPRPGPAPESPGATPVPEPAGADLSTPSTARRGALAALTVVPPVLLALFRCLDGIGTRQLWRDEHASWWAATLSFEDFRALLSNIDAVIAPYYLLLRVWIPAFGDSAASLRTPSALAMALSAALVAALGRRIRGMFRVRHGGGSVV